MYKMYKIYKIYNINLRGNQEKKKNGKEMGKLRSKIMFVSFRGPMLLHFKKSNEILETWSPHCKNLALKDPPSSNFHNQTDASVH